MFGRNVLMTASALALVGCSCVKPLRNDFADAIDLCGSIGKLQAANTYYMGDVKSLFVRSKAEQKVAYPELTPQLRASAMRSTSHCINLQLGKITPKTYDKLMALEATNAAAAELALTSEQLEALIAKGYRKVADILREARVSEAAIAKVSAVTAADLSPLGQLRPPEEPPEMQVLADINTKIGGLEETLKQMPAEVVKAMNGASVPPENHQAEQLIKVLFAPRSATLDSAALMALHKSLPDIGPNVRLSVVGSADASGDDLKNMELSRQRAQSVAGWLMVHRRIESRLIHVGARGAEKGMPISPDDRSVTVIKY